MVSDRDSMTFEIVVVLAIVAIVAFTGQVLIYYESTARTGLPPAGALGGDNVISGFAVAIAGEDEPTPMLADISVERIEVNPASPLVGEAFEVRVYVKNLGFQEIKTPFYVEAEFIPKTEETNVALDPIKISEFMPQALAPGDESYVAFLVTTIVPPGPMRIVAHADSTLKILDDNPANNKLSKTVIIALE
ncbi:hypothetical protein JW826_00355 [Candidatus Woesearchaeota archaeon]|nr:hypothetical protein [Candidatus Woesearchaeota archaeon]